MTKEEREAIRARCEAATPNGWEHNVNKTRWGDVHEVLVDGEYGKCLPHSDMDCEFIAYARQDILALLDTLAETKTALDKSIELQSHYAELLNMHDGGKRRGFSSGDEWMARLREMNAARLVRGE